VLACRGKMMKKMIVDPETVDFVRGSPFMRKAWKLAILLGFVVILATPSGIVNEYRALQDDDIVVTADADWAQHAAQKAETYFITTTYVPEVLDAAQVSSWEGVVAGLEAKVTLSPSLDHRGRLDHQVAAVSFVEGLHHGL
jgi:hypothetical protein